MSGKCENFFTNGIGLIRFCAAKQTLWKFGGPFFCFFPDWKYSKKEKIFRHFGQRAGKISAKVSDERCQLWKNYTCEKQALFLGK